MAKEWVITYGLGGYDLGKPNDNIVEAFEVEVEDEL